MQVILINGVSKSGKSTVAKLLKEKLAQLVDWDEILILSNASDVYATCMKAFGWNGEKDEQGRRLLINVTKAGYDYHPYFWELRTSKHLAEWEQSEGVKCKFLIIDDWRYINTYNFFKEKKCKIHTIKIDTPESFYNGYSETVKKDPSENLGFNFSVHVMHSENLDVLKSEVYSIPHLLGMDMIDRRNR